MERIRQIMAADEVYPHLSDDGSPPAEDFRPVADPRIVYLGVREESSPEVLGVFMFVPQSYATVEVHTCLRRPLWGMSLGATLKAAQWIFAHTRFFRIVTSVPAYNRLARRLALDSGMTHFGTNPRSFSKRGVLYDQELFGLSKDLS